MQPSNIFIEGYFARLMYRSVYKMHEYALHGGGKVFLGADSRASSRRSNCTSYFPAQK
jgi:NADH dehydrogenase